MVLVCIAHVGSSILYTNSRSLHLNNQCSVKFNATDFLVKDNLTGKTLLSIKTSRGLHSIPSHYVTPEPIALVACLDTAEVWHSRLCYPHPRTLTHLQATGVVHVSKKSFALCSSCQLEKSKRLPFQDVEALVTSIVVINRLPTLVL
ncbi:hypothetical protein ACH5RR_039532 [Cinchona calisaya]|uniref:GAG-pre-integrase domain-containing protein n=1 Tax=Cinchona calisaya TaxID=153742 RepID=A0ABD2Y203_9GENT